MTQQSHWTEESTDALAHRIAFDFIAQIESRMDEIPMNQSDLARILEVTEGAVSKLLNNPQNLTIRTIARYARALGIKAAIVAYNDGDPENKRGPINSQIFASCWNWAGKPHDVNNCACGQGHAHGQCPMGRERCECHSCTQARAGSTLLDEKVAGVEAFWAGNAVARERGRAEERERCAKIAERLFDWSAEVNWGETIAAAIRSGK